MNPVVVATFERSGTHLTIDLLRKNFKECRCWRLPGEHLERSYVNLDRLSQETLWPMTISQMKRQLKRGSRPVVKTHTTPRLEKFEGAARDFCQDLLAHSKVIYVVRDPRKVMVSYQLMRQGRPAASAEQLEEFLTTKEANGMTPVERWENHVKSWQTTEDTLILKYEDIVKNTYGVIQQISAFLEIDPINRKDFLPKKIESPWQRRFMRITQFNPESTAVLARGKSSNYRPILWEGFKTKKTELLLKEAEERLFDLKGV